MSLTSLKNLTLQFPREKEALSRLDALIDKAEVKTTFFSLTKLYDVSKFSTQYAFNYVLDQLVTDRVFKKIFRIETLNGGIEDFYDIEDIPEEIDDFRTGERIVVKREFIKVLYQLETKS